ncbi:hypothetical protein SNEBB_010486 [Seison nebaliae]|nr:hypothetical protein SNEBB_010486 [Seison nebaliae]
MSGDTEDKNECFHKDHHNLEVPKDKWARRYTYDTAAWDVEDENWAIAKYGPETIGWKNNGRIFFPFCGKDTDMKRLYDKGFEIVGVEYSDVAIEQFQKRSEIKLNKSKTSDGKFAINQSEDKRLTIFCGDFYEFKQEYLPFQSFDAVYDRGAFHAVNRDDRKKYVAVMLEIVSKETRYLLSDMYWPKEASETTVPDDYNDYVGEFFGPYFTYKLLETKQLERASMKLKPIDRFYSLRLK